MYCRTLGFATSTDSTRDAWEAYQLCIKSMHTEHITATLDAIHFIFDFIFKIMAIYSKLNQRFPRFPHAS